MGLHQICRDWSHSFNKKYFLDIVYDEETDDYVFSGVCNECGGWRVVRYSELKMKNRNLDEETNSKLLGRNTYLPDPVAK